MLDDRATLLIPSVCPLPEAVDAQPLFETLDVSPEPVDHGVREVGIGVSRRARRRLLQCSFGPPPEYVGKGQDISRQPRPLQPAHERAYLCLLSGGFLSLFVAGLDALGVFFILPLTQLLVLDPTDPLPVTARFLSWFVDVSSNDEAAAILASLVLVTFTLKGGRSRAAAALGCRRIAQAGSPYRAALVLELPAGPEVLPPQAELFRDPADSQRVTAPGVPPHRTLGHGRGRDGRPWWPSRW